MLQESLGNTYSVLQVRQWLMRCRMSMGSGHPWHRTSLNVAWNPPEIHYRTTRKIAKVPDIHIESHVHFVWSIFWDARYIDDNQIVESTNRRSVAYTIYCKNNGHVHEGGCGTDRSCFRHFSFTHHSLHICGLARITWCVTDVLNLYRYRCCCCGLRALMNPNFMNWWWCALAYLKVWNV